MPFDVKKFQKTEYVPRTRAVPLPDLQDFFGKAEEPVWIVRNLTGHELGMVNEASAKNRDIAAVLDGIVSVIAKDKVDAIKASLGLNDSVPNDIARRLEMLTLASVDPAIDHDVAVKLCENFPAEFFALTNAITELTGQGADVKKKPEPSIVTPASETP
jgi:hypothetical protein